MMFNILSIPSSRRLSALVDRLHASGIKNYSIYKGAETSRRYDGLFQTIQQVVKEHQREPYILLLEDDVCFTSHFSLPRMQKIIQQGTELSADIILGGIKEGSRLQQVNDELVRVHNYRGSQLMILYPKFYDQILNARIEQEFEIFCAHNANLQKYVAFPFLAYQMNGPSRFLSYEDHQKDYINFEQQIPALMH